MSKNSLVNKIFMGISMLFVSISLSSCGLVEEPMSQENVEQIGEYAGIILLKYDANHRSRLVDLNDLDLNNNDVQEEVIEEPVQEQVENEDVVEDNTEQENTVEDNTVVDENDSNTDSDEQLIEDNNLNYGTSMEEFMNLPEGITILYNGYDWADSLTNASGSFIVDPSDGRKLLVVAYSIKNDSDSSQNFNFFYSRYTFTLTINSSVSYIAMETPFTEDMPTFIGEVKKGESKELMLVFDVNESYIDAITTLDLNVKNPEGSVSLKLQ